MFVKNLKISQKLGLFTGGLLFIIIVFGTISFITVDNTKVNGEIYKEIVLGKDLVADILPPPEYIIESYLLCNQLFFETDKSKINLMIGSLKKLKNDYESRHQFWVNNLESGILKTKLINDSYIPVNEFYKLVDEQYIPAIIKDDKQTANSILTGLLKEKYEKHRKAIDSVVELANNRNSIKESTASNIVNENISLMSVIGAISVLLSIFLSYITVKSIVTPIKNATEIALEIARGDFDAINKIISINE